MTGRRSARDSARLSDRRAERAAGAARRCEVIANRESGGYRIFSALDRWAPSRAPASSTCSPAADGWGQRDGRPYLPRAFSVAEARPAERRLAARLPGRGGRAREPSGSPALRPGEGLWVTGPLGRPFSRARASWRRTRAGAILVGGGIGIAPLAILRRQLAERGVARPHA